MKITVGEWRTRGGRKAIVAGVNENSPEPIIGWRELKDGTLVCRSWQINGGYYSDEKVDDCDLVSPWTEPVPWDWSTTPPWINWIAQNANGRWSMFCNEHIYEDCVWCFDNGSWLIPVTHAPKWSGDWKLSKTMRPGYKETK